MDEEARALLFRQQEQARERAAYQRWLALAGSLVAYARLLSLTSALRRDEGWDPTTYLEEEEWDALGN